MPLSLREERPEKETVRQRARRRDLHTSGKQYCRKRAYGVVRADLRRTVAGQGIKERKKTERELLNELPLFAYMREYAAGGGEL